MAARLHSNVNENVVDLKEISQQIEFSESNETSKQTDSGANVSLNKDNKEESANKQEASGNFFS